VQAIRQTARIDAGIELRVLDAVEAANDGQKRVLATKVKARFGDDLAGRRFALWGLAFKPNTDDMREAPSRYLIADLLEVGASVVAYDPVAMDESRRIYGREPRLSYAESPVAALDGADALIIVTEWKEFRSPDFAVIKAKLKHPVVFDGRNLYDPAVPRLAGLEYHSIGRQ
jgi:UDPglucose 6-dehydrogenase